MSENPMQSRDEDSNQVEYRYEYSRKWNPFMVRFGPRSVPEDDVKKAIEALYKDCTMRKGDSGLTSLENMKAQFKFIRKQKHIEKLRSMKRDGIKYSKTHMKDFIGIEMEVQSDKRIADGEILDTKEYLEMFESIRNDHKIPAKIKASAEWVEEWKIEFAGFKKDDVERERAKKTRDNAEESEDSPDVDVET